MFENLLFQDGVKTSFLTNIEKRRLPQAMLFHGPQYSGKLTAALELARVLSCQKKGEWDCDCSGCRSQRRLEDMETLLVGGGYHWEETAAAMELAVEDDRLAIRFLLYRSVQKLLRRFDPRLWEGEETRSKKWQALELKVKESLEVFEPEVPWPNSEKRKTKFKSLLKDIKKLSALLPTGGIPVGVIRNISSWAHTTSQGNKIVILSRAENMAEGARNALLKTLEEPPRGTFFILLSAQKGAIMPTILSRVREYRFLDRSLLQQQKLISRIFRQKGEDFRDLKDFFLQIRDSQGESFRPMVDHFLDAIPHKEEEFPLSKGDLKDPVVFRSFCEELLSKLQVIHNQGQDAFWTIEKLQISNRLIHEIITRKERFGMGADLLLESLFFRIRKS